MRRDILRVYTLIKWWYWKGNQTKTYFQTWDNWNKQPRKSIQYNVKQGLIPQVSCETAENKRGQNWQQGNHQNNETTIMEGKQSNNKKTQEETRPGASFMKTKVTFTLKPDARSPSENHVQELLCTSVVGTVAPWCPKWLLLVAEFQRTTLENLTLLIKSR